MKRVPSSFRLMGHTLHVHVITKRQWSMTDCVAYFDPNANSIYVMRQGKSQVLHAFWHEVTHAMLYFMGHKLYSNEQFVDQIGGFLAQIMDSAE